MGETLVVSSRRFPRELTTRTRGRRERGWQTSSPSLQRERRAIHVHAKADELTKVTLMILETMSFKKEPVISFKSLVTRLIPKSYSSESSRLRKSRLIVGFTGE